MMKTIRVLVFVLFHLESNGQIANKSEPDVHKICGEDGGNFRFDYLQIGVGNFKYYDTPAQWHDAQEVCHLDGAELASPTTINMKNLMKKMFAPNAYNTQRVHTGYNSRYLAGDYMSISGIHLYNSPHKWGQGEPNPYRQRHNSIAMDANGFLYMVNFNVLLPFICFARKNINYRKTVCGTSDTEYDNVHFGKCYKFHPGPRVWYQALLACMGEGGNLLVIRDENEQEYINEFFKAIKPKMIWGAKTTQAHVGLYKDPVSGGWLSIFDENLEQVGYHNWNENEPNSVDEGCGAISNTALMNDVKCDDMLPFICEMKVRCRMQSEEEPIVKRRRLIEDYSLSQLREEKHLRQSYRSVPHESFPTINVPSHKRFQSIKAFNHECF